MKTHFLWKALQTILAMALFWLGLRSRAPLFIEIREFLPLIVFLLAGLVVVWHFLQLLSERGQPSTFKKHYHRVMALLFLLAAVLPIFNEVKFMKIKKQVLNSHPQILRKIGKHFIVGYTDYEEIKNLVSHGAIGGVFITQRNIKGKTSEEVKGQLQILQQLQRAQGLPPLLIATDQEGGLVSRLSPLVRPLPPLSALGADLNKVVDYAKGQAIDLSRLGVNVNFSPVVDLKPLQDSSFFDRHSLISYRAISVDPQVVTQVAEAYSQSLRHHGVFPTLKHFPGLAQVNMDTHSKMGELPQSVDFLSTQDWIPFQKILASTEAFLMLGHVKVLELDPDYPASLSRKVVQKLLRQQWGFQGILITDDFAMGPIYHHPESVSGAALRALNAGIDLLLFSFDGELYYEAMQGLLEAHGRGELAQGFLTQSAKRLAKVRSQVSTESPTESICYGTRAKGSIKHAWQLPEQGINYKTYSQLGVSLGRTYVHSRVYRVLLAAYEALAKSKPEVSWVYGETGLREGGPIYMHITHQNGLSVDHMVPVSNGEGNSVPLPGNLFNKFGYNIEFDAFGKYEDYTIDFEAMAEHLYQIDRAAKKEGIGIRRVIFDPKLRRFLHSTKRWAYLKKHVTFSKYPSKLRHDEHYHIDFKVSCR